MRALDWEVTIRFRPLRLLKRLGVLCGLFLAASIPVSHVGTASDQPASIEVQSHRNAVTAVERILAQKASFKSGEREALANTIVTESVRNDFDPLFILAVIENESGFDPRTPSVRCRVPGVESTCYANARGLMQIIPSTWKAEVRRRGLGDMDELNPMHNVNVGVGYLGHLGVGFKRPGSLLWAYNQGSAVATAHARGEVLDSFEAPRWEKAVREAGAFESRVMRTYAKLLAQALNVVPTQKLMTDLYRHPHRSIYRPTKDYSSDVHGVTPRPYKAAPKHRVQPIRSGRIFPSNQKVLAFHYQNQPIFQPMLMEGQ